MEKAQCIVCGMEIEPTEERLVEFEGREYYCCEAHIEEFKANPLKFIKK